MLPRHVAYALQEPFSSGTLHPWTRGECKRTCNNMGILLHFKGTNIIKTLLMSPKNRDSKLQKSGVIYKFKCPHIKCQEEYVGKSGRCFWDRLNNPAQITQLYLPTTWTNSPSYNNCGGHTQLNW